MLRLTLHTIWARKRRVVSSSAAIVIGVAFLAATMILGSTMERGLNTMLTEGFNGVAADVRSDHVVGSGEDERRATLPGELAASLEARPEIADVAIQVNGIAQVVDVDGDPIGGDGPPTVGISWDELPDSSLVITQGRGPVDPNEVVLHRSTAEDAGYSVGDTATIKVPTDTEYTVVGIADFESGQSIAPVTAVYFETSTAQTLFTGGRDEVSTFLLEAADGYGDDDVAEAATAALTQAGFEGAEVRTNQQIIDDELAALDADFLGFFKIFLTVFAVIALLVAMFSIGNTFSILVAQRTRESALMRALGASRRQVLATVTAEAFAVGLIASALGLAGGYGLAIGLDALMSAGGVGIPAASVTFDVNIALIAAAVGVVMTVAASLLPALRASAVAPLAAMREVDVDRSGASKWRAATGILAIVAGVVAIVGASSLTSNVLWVTAGGALATLAGAVLLGPFAARYAAGVIGAPIRMIGRTNGLLAKRNAQRSPKRTAGTATSLMIGVAVVVLFATLGSSLKASLSDVVDDSFGGDYLITDENFSGPGLDPALNTAVQQLDEVATTTRLLFVPVNIDDEPSFLNGVDMATFDSSFDMDVLEGSIADSGVGDLAVSSAFAEEHDLTMGSTVDATFVDGATEALTVTAIYGQDALFGGALVDASTAAQHTPDLPDRMIFIRLADGVSIDDARPALIAVASSYGNPTVQDADEYLDSQASQLDAMLTLVYGLLGLAVLIAVLSIANTLSLSVHERTRELGLLRAVGQTRRAVRSTVRWESVIIALFGTLGGIGLGTFLGWGMMRGLAATEGFGSFAVPTSSLAVVAIAAVAVGVVAALLPARRAARLDVLQAIAEH